MRETKANTSLQELAMATETATAEMELATQFEIEAEELRRQAPLKTNAAIYRATSQLITDTADGLLTTRESLEITLEINQYKPSGVAWSGPPDTSKVLDTFDKLSEEDTPFIIFDSHNVSAGITGREPATLEIVKAVGMGGLPDAHIGFSTRGVTADKNNRPIVSIEKQKIFGIRQLGAVAAGKVAIQSVLDTSEIHTKPFRCGHGHHSNETAVRSVLISARLLAEVAGLPLDTEDIETRLQSAANLRVHKETVARRAAAFRQAMPFRIY